MAGNTQLVSIDADGNLSTIRRKRDKGLDLRDVGGEFSVRRVSEIAWSDADRGFCIFLQPENGSPEVMTRDKLHEVGMSFDTVCKKLQNKGGARIHLGILYFDDYEDAVEIEVMYLETAKALGVSYVW